MNRRAVGRVGLGLIAGATLAMAAGCASMSGWGPTPPRSGAPVAAQQGAPRFVQTTGMKLTEKEEAVKVPSWIRVQDCTIVAISSPSRWACPDGKVYTGNELYHARNGG
jgi:hypothetical protein